MAVYQSLGDNLETHFHTLVETLELEPVASHLIAQELPTSDRYKDIEALSQIVGQNMRDIWLNLEVGYNKHFLVEYCSRDVPDHESK